MLICKPWTWPDINSGPDCSAPSENKAWHCTFCPWMCADKRNNWVIIFWQCCSDAGACPCSLCIHSVFLHGSALPHQQQLRSSSWISPFQIRTVRIAECIEWVNINVELHSIFPSNFHIKEKKQGLLFPPSSVFSPLHSLPGLLPSGHRLLQLLHALQDINRCQNTMFFLVALCEPWGVYLP